MSDDPVIMEGYLQKKKSKGIKGIRGWHDVYVLLTKHTLSYYRKRDEGRKDAKVQVTKLVDIESIKYLKDEDLRRFDVRLHKDLKVFSFRSLTNDVKGTMYAQKWAERLEEVTEKYHAAPVFRGQAKKDDGNGNLSRLQQYFFKHKTKLPQDAPRDLRNRETNELLAEFPSDVSILRSLLDTVLADNGDFDYDDSCDEFIEPGNKVDQEQSSRFEERPKHVQVSDSIRRRRKRIADTGGGSINSVSRSGGGDGGDLSPEKSMSDPDLSHRSRGPTQTNRSAERPDWIKKNIEHSAALSATKSESASAHGGGSFVDDWDEPHRNPLVNLLRSKEFTRVLTEVFQAEDPQAHSLGLRVLWLVYRGLYAPLELMFQFAAFVQVNCSGRKFTPPVHRAFCTILLSDNVASQLIFDEEYWPPDRRLRDMYEQVQQKKAKEKEARDHDIDERFKSGWTEREQRVAHCSPNHIDLVVRHHQAWPALLAALRGSPLQTRIRALMDINDIINNSYHNAMSLWRCGGGEGFADPITAGFHSGGPGSWKKPQPGDSPGLLGKLFGRKGTTTDMKGGAGSQHEPHSPSAGSLHSSSGASSTNSNAGGAEEVNYSQWQLWVWPMLADLPEGGDSDDLCRILHVLIVGVFTAVHLQFFVHSKNFYHVLTSSLDSLRLFSGFNHESQLAANAVLCALVSILQDIYHVVFNTQVVHNKSWYNLFELTSAVRKFVFTTSYWNDPAIFSTQTATRQAAHRTLSHRLSQRKLLDKQKQRTQSKPEAGWDDDELAHAAVSPSATLNRRNYTDVQNAKSLFTYVAVETDHGVHFTFEGHAADMDMTTNLGRLFHTLLQRCKDDDTTIHIKPPASEKYKALLVLLEQEGRFWRDARTILDLLYLDMLHRHRTFKLKKLSPFIIKFVTPWYMKGKHKIPEENESVRRAVIKELRAALFDLTSNFEYADQKLFGKILQLGSVSAAIPPTVAGVGDPYQFAPADFALDYKASLVHQSLIGPDLDVGGGGAAHPPPSPAGPRAMSPPRSPAAHAPLGGGTGDEKDDFEPPPLPPPRAPQSGRSAGELLNSFFTPPDDSGLTKPPQSFNYVANPPKKVAVTPEMFPLSPASPAAHAAHAAPASPRAGAVSPSKRNSNSAPPVQQPAMVRPSSPGGGGGGGGMMMSPQAMKHMAASRAPAPAPVAVEAPPPSPRMPPGPAIPAADYDEVSKSPRKKSVHFPPEFGRSDSTDIDEKTFEITMAKPALGQWSMEESGPPPPPPAWPAGLAANVAAANGNASPKPPAGPAPPKSPPPPEAFKAGAGAKSPGKAGARPSSPAVSSSSSSSSSSAARGSESRAVSPPSKSRPSEARPSSAGAPAPPPNPPPSGKFALAAPPVSPGPRTSFDSAGPPPMPPPFPPASAAPAPAKFSASAAAAVDDDDDGAPPEPPPNAPVRAPRHSSAQAPFTAPKATDPIDPWCEDNRFTAYMEGLKSLGAENLSDLVILTSKDLDSIDMKMLHKRRFLAAIEELAEDLNKQK